MGLEYGKRIIHESYFDGMLKSTRTEYSVPELIRDRSHALSEIMKCMELIDQKQTDNITIVIKADPKTHEIRLITKIYTI
jgi:hypothetical protein